MTDQPQEPFTLVTSPTVRLQLTELLPEAVAFPRTSSSTARFCMIRTGSGSASTHRWQIG